MNIEIWNEVHKRIHNPDNACQFISGLMENCKDKTFNDLITANFTNSPSEIQNSANTFISECNKAFNLKAIYLEMNGFDINPDRWFFDFFGYETMPENDNNLITWISRGESRHSPYFPSITLSGLESIQKLYEQYEKENSHNFLNNRDGNLRDNHELATLMVMAKFCKKIDECLDSNALGISILSTAHDFDIVFHKRT